MNSRDALDAPLFLQSDEDRLKAEIQERWKDEKWKRSPIYATLADRAVAVPQDAKNGHSTRADRVLKVLSDGQWHPGHHLTGPEAGGSEGLRRLRELREKGYQIEMRKREGLASREYRLTGRKRGR